MYIYGIGIIEYMYYIIESVARQNVFITLQTGNGLNKVSLRYALRP